MKLIAYAPVYGRHEAVKLFARSLTANGIQGFVVISNEVDRQFCQSIGLYTHEEQNSPLSAKIQNGLEWLKTFEWDAVVMLGSDDVVEGYDKIIELLKEYECVAFGDCHYHDLNTKEDGYWPGYTHAHRYNEPAGAGRFLTRELMERMDWNLWTGATGGSLDFDQWKRIQAATEKIKIVFTEDGVKLTDYKDSDSLTPFKHLKASTDPIKAMQIMAQRKKA
jgi:hypothetical protein